MKIIIFITYLDRIHIICSSHAYYVMLVEHYVCHSAQGHSKITKWISSICIYEKWNSVSLQGFDIHGMVSYLGHWLRHWRQKPQQKKTPHSCLTFRHFVKEWLDICLLQFSAIGWMCLQDCWQRWKINCYFFPSLELEPSWGVVCASHNVPPSAA